MRKLAGIHGFTIDDFLPNGRFAEKMRERIDYNHGLIKEKSCKVVRGIIRRSFPNIGK